MNVMYECCASMLKQTCGGGGGTWKTQKNSKLPDGDHTSLVIILLAILDGSHYQTSQKQQLYFIESTWRLATKTKPH